MSGPIPAPGRRGRGLERDLASLVGPRAVSIEPADLWAASRDTWVKTILRTRARLSAQAPDAVVWPADAAQVAAILRFAGPRQIPVVPFGSGSGGGGGALPVQGGIVLDLKRLATPPAIDLPARTVEASAGTLGRVLAARLAEEGAALGHETATGTVGGWLATRSAGRGSTRYGKIEDIVLSLEAVDGTGELLRTLDVPSAGPDLTQLLVGSEGTLAVFTSAKLRIWPRPRARWTRGVRFPSLRAGIAAARAVLRAGFRPAQLRLRDPLDALLESTGPVRLPRPLRWLADGAQKETLKLALRAPALLNRLADAFPGGTLLALGFDGGSEEDVADEGEAALALCQGERGEDLGPVPAERGGRERTVARLLAAGAFVDTLDVATTWDRLSQLHESVRQAAASHALVFAELSHAALEGCAIEFTFSGLAGDGSDPEEEEARYDACWTAALSAAADAGATLSHHRGVGLSRQAFLAREHGDGMRQLRALKKAFDPHGVLNPGKLLL